MIYSLLIIMLMCFICNIEEYKSTRKKIVPYPPPLEMIKFPKQLLDKTIPPYDNDKPDIVIDVKPYHKSKLCRLRHSKNMFSENVRACAGMDTRVNKFISTLIPRQYVKNSF